MLIGVEAVPPWHYFHIRRYIRNKQHGSGRLVRRAVVHFSVRTEIYHDPCCINVIAYMIYCYYIEYANFISFVNTLQQTKYRPLPRTGRIPFALTNIIMMSKSLQSAAIFMTIVGGVFAGKTAPSIELSYGPKVVTAGNTFSVSLAASDPAGIDRVTFSATPNKGWYFPCSEATQFSLVNGTVYDGMWMVECPTLADTPSQLYGFTYNCFNTMGDSVGDYIKTGFQVKGGPEAEYNPPVIESVTCSETVTAGSTLSIYLKITDDSGVAGSTSYVQLHQTNGHVYFAATDFVLDSGTTTDGTWVASTVVDSDIPNGQYWFEIHVYDTQNNPAQLNVQDGVEVVGGAEPDHIAPSIADFKYADTTVEWGQTLYLSATISDQQSGIDYVNFAARESYSQTLCCEGPMTLKNGDKTSGVWEFSCVVPSDIDIAYYEGAIYAYDNQNNEGYTTSSFQVVVPSKV
jgi:hypothetical protein